MMHHVPQAGPAALCVAGSLNEGLGVIRQTPAGIWSGVDSRKYRSGYTSKVFLDALVSINRSTVAAFIYAVFSSAKPSCHDKNLRRIALVLLCVR